MPQKQIVPLDVTSGEDRRNVDRQVERLLAHPLFRLSKRLPAFLHYVVQESLNNGSDGPPKERTLGIQVFGRKPDYDTSADPIVRVTATELRKKLAQYYYEDGHNDEIRIELPPGSYLPKFRKSVVQEDHETGAEDAPVSESSSAEMPVNLEPVAATPAIPVVPVEPADALSVAEKAAVGPVVANVSADSVERRSLSWRLVAVMTSVLLVAALAGYVPLWNSLKVPQIGRFWRSFTGGASEALLVMPVIANGEHETGARPSDVSVAPNLSIEDAMIASRVAAQLEKQGIRYRMVSSSDLSFGELRTVPSVLLGALDNIWTMRLTKELPFIFEESADGRTARIVDTAARDHRAWAVDITTPHIHIAHDYGVVARYRSRLTGEPVMVIAGISSQGTQAAGEVLTTPEYLASALAATHNAANFELVIETEALDGRAGPPRIVASQTW